MWRFEDDLEGAIDDIEHYAKSRELFLSSKAEAPLEITAHYEQAPVERCLAEASLEEAIAAGEVQRAQTIQQVGAAAKVTSDQHAVLAYVTARESYNYLPARLVPAGDARPDIELWSTLKLKIDSPNPLTWGTPEGRENHRSIDLDRYHQDLLQSPEDDPLLQGFVSVYFWGFAYGLDGRDRFGRALGKVKVLRDGYGMLPNQRPNEILGYLKTARTCLIENKDPVRALKAAMEIRFLGMSFASKVLAFMDPQHCGIYDSRISEKLEASRDLELRRLHVPARGDHHHRKELQAEVYADWCSWCTRKAGEINALGVKWRDWDGSPQDWRAIDVERSVFASPASS